MHRAVIEHNQQRKRYNQIEWHQKPECRRGDREKMSPLKNNNQR